MHFACIYNRWKTTLPGYTELHTSATFACSRSNSYSKSKGSFGASSLQSP